MALPAHILVHQGVPLTYDEPAGGGEWIEGEPGPDGGGVPAQGPAFACVLFLPLAAGEQQNAYRPRVVKEPLLLFNATRVDGSAVVLARESELLVTAVELAPWTGAGTARWQLVGVATPFGPPGRVFGVQASLRQILD